MSSSNVSTKSAGAGMLAAIVASLCCITPVFSLVAGISGIAATFSWMEPIRPYLITLTIGVLAFAWYQKLKPRTAEEINCECDEDDKPSFWQTKSFLSMITIISIILLAFPSYSYMFYPDNSSSNASTMMLQDSTETKSVIFEVEGMTCTGCENHIIFEVEKLEGIKSVNASYESGTASVEFFIFKVKEDDIINAINKTGYKIIDKKKERSSN